MELGRDDVAHAMAVRPLSPRPVTCPGVNYWVTQFAFQSVPGMRRSTISVQTDIIAAAGLNPSPVAEAELTQLMCQTVEERVGYQLTAGFTEEQWDEFQSLVDTDRGADNLCLEWLQLNVSDYPFVVRAEVSRLRRELQRRTSPAI